MPAADSAAAPVAVVDTMLSDDLPYEVLANEDSVRRLTDRLEQELARAPAADQPRLLLEIGRLKKHYNPSRGTPGGDYAESRGEEFWYNEIGGNYLYTGTHLKQLIEKFPNDPRVDDAAYQLTMLQQGGECEGFVTCYVAVVLHQVDDFLAAYPNSPYAPRALARAIEGFDSHLKDVDLTKKTYEFDPAELPPILARFDSVTVGLPAPLRARADSLLASVRGRLRGP